MSVTPDVRKEFIAQCKMWSHERQWKYMDTSLADVLQGTERGTLIGREVRHVQ